MRTDLTPTDKVVLAQKKIQELHNKVQKIYAKIAEKDPNGEALWQRSQRLGQASNRLSVFSDQLLCKHNPAYLGCDGENKDLFLCENCGTIISMPCPEFTRTNVHVEFDTEILDLVVA